MIYGAMATYPARFGNLGKVIDSILPQLDMLYVYINESDFIPECLLHDKITPLLGKDHEGDLSATGKVYPLNYIKDGYCFTLDDDFVFPADYISRMKHAIDRFDKKAIMTVHGSIFAPNADWYYERSIVYEVKQALDTYRFVNLPGSATLAFHTSTLDIQYSDFPKTPMVDLQFAIQALEQQVPILAIPREESWLSFLNYSGLWETNKNEMTHHTSAMLKHGPWSFDRCRAFYRTFANSLSPDLLTQLDTEVLKCLDHGFPRSWGDTKIARITKARHRELIQTLNDTHKISRFVKRNLRALKNKTRK
jgi:hypothetical protein